MTANAGYHLYNTGDVLTAAQVQFNLQNQSVMYFATASARTTAIGSVTVEGMVTYIPANGIEYYNGTAWVTLSTGGDITDVNTAVTSGLTGGATSGSVNLSLLLNFNAQTGTTYTLASTDLNKLVTTSNASAITVTVPPSVFSAGQQINVQSIGAGITSFAQGSGVTITSTGATAAAPKLRAQYSAATVICTGSNTFTIIGDLS
jgi:hypothetical protein